MTTVITSKNDFLPDIKTSVLPEQTISALPFLAIVDTGATGHYLDTSAEPHCLKVQHTGYGLSVRVLVANGQTIETTK